MNPDTQHTAHSKRGCHTQHEHVSNICMLVWPEAVDVVGSRLAVNERGVVHALRRRDGLGSTTLLMAASSNAIWGVDGSTVEQSTKSKHAIALQSGDGDDG